MELFYLDRRKGFHDHDDSATPEFSGRSEDQHQHLTVAAPQVQSDLSLRIRKPLPSDEKKARSCQSCHKTPCSCSGAALPHSDLYPVLPAKMMILEFLIRSLRHPTRTHNVSDLDDLISDGTSTGSVTLDPSEKMMLDSLHALVNAKTRSKGPQFFLSGSKTRKTRSRSHIITQSEILNLISPETWETCSPGASPSRHEKMLPSCSNTASKNSNQPMLASDLSSHSAGLLQCIWKDGLPHFELSLDNPLAVYTANPVKVQSNDRALDYIYLFHSGEQGKKDWTGNPTSVSKLVGKMKVSSSLVLNQDKSSSMETEFVLYGSPDDYLRQMQSSYSVVKGGKGLVKRVAEIMRPANVSSSPKHIWRFGKSSSQQFDDLTEILGAELNIPRESHGLMNLMDDDLPTNQEVAAIVVREQRRECREEPIVGGWGLKFLEMAGATSSEGTNVQNGKDRSARRISVIIPRGFHGGPASKNGGAAGLIERWRSGGRCDCGGWDLGCPIRVLNNDGCGSSPQAEATQTQDSTSVGLSIKGVKKNEQMLKLVNVTEDLYILYFDSSLSPLQCFSTGIAIIHSQTSPLYPKL